MASVSRYDKFKGLFCKRALYKRRYSAKATYNLVDPTNRSHPISYSGGASIQISGCEWSAKWWLDWKWFHGRRQSERPRLVRFFLVWLLICDVLNSVRRTQWSYGSAILLKFWNKKTVETKKLLEHKDFWNKRTRQTSWDKHETQEYSCACLEMIKISNVVSYVTLWRCNSTGLNSLSRKLVQLSAASACSSVHELAVAQTLIYLCTLRGEKKDLFKYSVGELKFESKLSHSWQDLVGRRSG